ncbi:hypothetical protein Y1Q_0016396 [Alligator mississippiensis]|uniref:Uncharacterized protein n=1 Tax=Alligator mississippiensis TaxID=8496 RepID=A0A151N370_ALLMI|nr:hypothetical protein Y1Q_0016396 [Alligator mississippiensis]
MPKANRRCKGGPAATNLLTVRPGDCTDKLPLTRFFRTNTPSDQNEGLQPDLHKSIPLLDLNLKETPRIT